MKNLKNTVWMMTSEDHRDRFRAEYLQLQIRADRLAALLDKMRAGSLKFKPKCSRRLLQKQLRIMRSYAAVLRERARIEEIDL